MTESYTLAYDTETKFEIFVDRFDQDDISSAIRAQAYRFPLPFDLLKILAPPNVRVLDLGAHIGTFSLLAAKLGYQVASVEASPRNAALLLASAKDNHFDDLQLLPVAVSNRSETLEFIQAGPYGLVATPLIDNPTIPVKAMNVDEILVQLAWDKVEFIKMDVEGSEVKAVEGMKGLLARADSPPILYESNGHTLHYFGETPNNLMAALEAFGYHCYLIEPGQLIPLRSSELLFLCTVDCLATKGPPDALKGWKLRAPFTRKERIAHILSMAADAHPHPRGCIARTLQDAGIELLADSQVRSALARLAQDTDGDVRAGAQWSLSADFQRTLSEKQAEIAGSEGFVQRALNSIRCWWEK